jgi:DNA-binding winged helix-turn-helix (wHTH) protein
MIESAGRVLIESKGISKYHAQRMRVRFAPFTFDSGRQQLLADGREVALSPKAFEVLQLLLEHRPDVVDKETIAARVWPETHVSDASLTVVVAEIRRALADTPESPRFVRTAHRRGYAFIAEVEDLDDGARAGAEARFWIVSGDKTFILPAGETLIGRDPASGIWLNVPSVSGRHARIVVRGQTATIEDLKSTNGTFVRGARIRERTELRHGDRVHLGEVPLTVGASGGRNVARTERLPEKRKR